MSLPFPNAGRDLHPQGLRGRLSGARIGTLQPNRAARTVQGFVQRHQNVTLDVLAALGECLAFFAVFTRSAEATEWTTATAEELLEEITETCAIEMEFSTLLRGLRRTFPLVAGPAVPDGSSSPRVHRTFAVFPDR